MPISSFYYAQSTAPPPTGTNALILGLTYPHGATPTVTDNNGNTWPGSPAVSADGGTGNYVASIFVLPNVKSGQTTLTVTFGANITPFNYALTEVSNIAASSPVDVTGSAALVSGPTLASGAMTTTQSGNFVWSYFPLGARAVGRVSSFAANSGFTLLDADIAWIRNDGFPHASQYQSNVPTGAINPGMTATLGAGSNSSYNCVSVALKTTGTPKVIQHIASSADPVAVGGPAGDGYKIPIFNSCGNTNPTGLYVNKCNHFTMDGTIGAGTWNIQFPCVGNLRVFPFQVSQNDLPISGITDSDGNTWTQATGSTGCMIWYAKNTTPNQNLVVHVAITSNTGGSSPSIRALDISGAHATTPIDATGEAASTDATNLTSVAHKPDITVPTAGDLVIAGTFIGLGPGLAATSPANARFDLCTFTGELDSNLIENADCFGHLYNAPAVTLNWTWTITSNSPNSMYAAAVAIKSA